LYWDAFFFLFLVSKAVSYLLGSFHQGYLFGALAHPVEARKVGAVDVRVQVDHVPQHQHWTPRRGHVTLR